MFDLKGSVTGRDAKPGENVKKDNDVRRGLPDSAFALPSAVHQSMRRQVERDSTFLKEMKIMDYSMLVGVHYVPWRSAAHHGSGAGSYQEQRSVSVKEPNVLRDLLKQRKSVPTPNPSSVSALPTVALGISGGTTVGDSQEEGGAAKAIAVARGGKGGAKDASASGSGKLDMGDAGVVLPSGLGKPLKCPATPTVKLHLADVGRDESMPGGGQPKASADSTSFTHRRVADGSSSFPVNSFEDKAGTLVGAGELPNDPSVASYSTIDHYFDEDDDYSYLEGAGRRGKTYSDLDDWGSSTLFQSGIGIEGDEPGSGFGHTLRPDVVEIKKEEAIEQMYWPFHRHYDIAGRRRMIPISIPRAGEELEKKQTEEENVDSLATEGTDPQRHVSLLAKCCFPEDAKQEHGKAKYNLQNFEPPISNRKDGGFMMDNTGLDLPIRLQTGPLKKPGVQYEGKIFYMGIIDVLQQFNIRKRFEAKYRRLRGSGWQDASCVHPHLYAERFVVFFDEYSQRNGIPKVEGQLIGDDAKNLEETLLQKLPEKREDLEGQNIVHERERGPYIVSTIVEI